MTDGVEVSAPEPASSASAAPLADARPVGTTTSDFRQWIRAWVLPPLMILVALAIALPFPLIAFRFGINEAYQELYQRNFALIIGLPLAAFGSLFLVIFFVERQRGMIEFKAPGFELKGASGPIVLWILCYLAFASSFKMLWTPPEAVGSDKNKSGDAVLHADTPSPSKGFLSAETEEVTKPSDAAAGGLPMVSTGGEQGGDRTHGPITSDVEAVP